MRERDREIGEREGWREVERDRERKGERRREKKPRSGALIIFMASAMMIYSVCGVCRVNASGVCASVCVLSLQIISNGLDDYVLYGVETAAQC